MISPATIRLGAAFWLAVRPWKALHTTIRAARNRRRARLGKPLLPPLDSLTIGTDHMNYLSLALQLGGMVLARLLPAAISYLGSEGVTVATNADTTTTIVMAVVLYVVIHVIAAVRKKFAPKAS